MKRFAAQRAALFAGVVFPPIVDRFIPLRQGETPQVTFSPRTAGILEKLRDRVYRLTVNAFSSVNEGDLIAVTSHPDRFYRVRHKLTSAQRMDGANLILDDVSPALG